MAGSLPAGLRKRLRLGSICRWKALWVGEVVHFDEWPAEAILVLREHTDLRIRITSGRDRERQRSFASLVHGRKRQAKVALPKGGARSCLTPPAPPKAEQEEERGCVRESAEAGGAPSSACPAGVGSPRGGLPPQGRTRPSVGEALCGQRSTFRRDARPEVERSTGARIVSRLQRSVRSIFSAPSRKPRGKPRGYGVARSGGSS